MDTDSYIRTWYLTSKRVKNPELRERVEWHQVKTVGLASFYALLGLPTSLRGVGVTEVTHGKKQMVCVDS